MLTKDDLTVANCLEVIEEVIPLGVRHLGFKDVGVPLEVQRALLGRIRDAGATSYFEVVSETPEAWWVRIPPQRNRGEAERRVVELNLLGVSDTFIVQESGPNQNAVSLGLFKTENRARILLGQLRAKGVENAGIEPRMSTSYRIQANVPANELRIVESAAPGLRAKRQACTR